jgi:hypothetical protein
MNCVRPECNTTAGCAHRGPRGELCWFGTWGDERDARISELEAALRPFAEAQRWLGHFSPFMREQYLESWCTGPLKREDFGRAADLVQ